MTSGELYRQADRLWRESGIERRIADHHKKEQKRLYDEATRVYQQANELKQKELKGGKE